VADTVKIYPHPLVCPGSQVAFNLEKAGTVRLRVLSQHGQVLRDFSQHKDAGLPTTLFLGCTDLGQGLFFLKLDIQFDDGSDKHLSPRPLVVSP
jgi:hypothetical protein